MLVVGAEFRERAQRRYERQLLQQSAQDLALGVSVTPGYC